MTIPAHPQPAPTPRTDAVAKTIGSLAAAYKFGDLTGNQFASAADDEMSTLRTLERLLAERDAQLANRDVHDAYVKAEVEQLNRRLAERDAEVARLNNIITGAFPETAALHELLSRAGCVSVSKADYEELQALRTSLRVTRPDLYRNEKKE